MITVDVPVYTWIRIKCDTDDEQQAIEEALAMVRAKKTRTYREWLDAQVVDISITNAIVDSGFQVRIVKNGEV